MYKNLFLALSTIAILSSCSTQKKELTRADLKPILKIYVLDKENMPVKPAYIYSLYNDQRIELVGYSKIDKIGNYTTVLNEKEYSNLISTTKKFGDGHFLYNDPKETIAYDAIYYPLQKDVSMANPKIYPINEKTIAYTSLLNEILTYKNWIKRDVAPKIFGDVIPNELIVSLKPNTDASEFAKSLFDSYGTKVKSCLDQNTHTWLITFEKGDKNMLILAMRKNENVIGVIENSKINTTHLQTFSIQELIVQFNQAVNIDEWVKNYSNHSMQKVKQVAPNMNYYVVSFDSHKISAKEMIATIKKDSKVKEVQLNGKVSPRE